MNDSTTPTNLSTADLVAASQPAKTSVLAQDAAEAANEHSDDVTTHAAQEKLVALFKPDVAADFGSRWNEVQTSFVDDPKNAVRQADELVAKVMASLAETFARERSELERYVGDAGSASTENLRVALTRYRSFFQRLLNL